MAYFETDLWPVSSIGAKLVQWTVRAGFRSDFRTGLGPILRWFGWPIV